MPLQVAGLQHSWVPFMGHLHSRCHIFFGSSSVDRCGCIRRFVSLKEKLLDKGKGLVLRHHRTTKPDIADVFDQWLNLKLKNCVKEGEHRRSYEVIAIVENPQHSSEDVPVSQVFVKGFVGDVKYAEHPFVGSNKDAVGHCWTVIP